jgi:hypothetical protein
MTSEIVGAPGKGDAVSACNSAGLVWADTTRSESYASAEAQRYFQQACRLNDRYACYNLSVSEVAYNLRIKYLRRACNLGHHWSCTDIADKLVGAEGNGNVGAATYHAEACWYGSVESCIKLSKRADLYRGHLTQGYVGQMRTKLCRIDAQACKKKENKI